ncbi:MAG: tyrosine-type recombinase/integrase [Anaerolineales bacterium]
MSATLSTAIEEFIEFKKAERLSKSTLIDYAYTLKKFSAVIGDDFNVASISSKQIVHYLASLQVSKKRVKNIYTTLSSFFRWAVAEGYCRTNVVRSIRPPKPEKRPISPFTRDQIIRMLDATEFSIPYSRPGKRTCQNTLRHTKRDRLIILILLDTGIRASELCGLRVCDITPEGLYVRGKGSKDRIVPISEEVRKVLLDFVGPQNSPNAVVFQTELGNPLTPNSLRLIICRIANRAKVANAHPHRFRHTFAINFLRNGGDPFSLQMILGHETLDMVKRYLAIVQTDIQAAHRRASPVAAWGLST